MINFSNTEYIHSAYKINQLLKNEFYEFAFVGRSNVGKSSLINCLTNRKRLAHISGKPGKTKTVNYFITDRKISLVDLPGYGFAHANSETRSQWEKTIEHYLLKSERLLIIFILWDMRNSPNKKDALFMEWVLYHKLPFHIILTKSDKLSNSQKIKRLKEINSQLPYPFPMLPFSTVKKNGVDDLKNIITLKWKEYC